MKNLKNYSDFINENLESEFLNEAKITKKDWDRMYDLIKKDNDGTSVAKSIKNKDKAIARFIIGNKLQNRPEILFDKDRSDEKRGYVHWDNSVLFTKFGDIAIELGATLKEITDAYDELKTPVEYLNKINSTSDDVKKMLQDSDLYNLINKLVTNGFDVKKERTSGPLTYIGRDAMSRNGAKWTMPYNLTITKNDKTYQLQFDIITDEGGYSSKFSFSNKSSKDIIKIIESIKLNTKHTQYGSSFIEFNSTGKNTFNFICDALIDKLIKD